MEPGPGKDSRKDADVVKGAQEPKKPEEPTPDTEPAVRKPKKGRPPRCEPHLGVVSYDFDREAWTTDKGYYWHGARQLGGKGWTKEVPK